MTRVTFLNADINYTLKNKKVITSFIEEIFNREKQQLTSLTYVFCSDDYLLDINKKFLQHDYFTDVITFDLTEPQDDGTTGEIYISIDRIKDNSTTEKTTFKSELLRVMFHGALHLCGYKDKKKSEITIIRQKEDQYLLLFKKFSSNA